MRLLDPAHHRVTPWRNGGGSTAEVAVDPPGASLEAFRWRVSHAQVPASGPFSAFPGVDRTLVVLEGAGLVLCREDGEQRLEGPLALAAFPGDGPTFGRLLGGPCRDFNVMTRRDACRHEVRILEAGEAGEAGGQEAGDATVLLYAARGRVRVEADGARADLDPGWAVRLDGGGPWRLAGSGTVIQVRILPATGRRPG